MPNKLGRRPFLIFRNYPSSISEGTHPQGRGVPKYFLKKMRFFVIFLVFVMFELQNRPNFCLATVSACTRLSNLGRLWTDGQPTVNRQSMLR